MTSGGPSISQSAEPRVGVKKAKGRGVQSPTSEMSLNALANVQTTDGE